MSLPNIPFILRVRFHSSNLPTSDLDLTQTDDLLLLVPAAVQDDAAVHQHVVEEEESLGLRLASTLLHQPALSQQNPARLEQGQPRRAEGLLHCLDAAAVLLVRKVHRRCEQTSAVAPGLQMRLTKGGRSRSGDAVGLSVDSEEPVEQEVFALCERESVLLFQGKATDHIYRSDKDTSLHGKQPQLTITQETC